MTGENVTTSETAATNEPVEAPAPKKERKPKAAKERKAEADVRYETIDSGNAKAWARVLLPEGEDDPRWDPRLLLKLDKDFVIDLAENGVEVDIDVTEVDGAFHVNDGKTRVRAIPEANAIRAKKGLPPLQVGLKIKEREDLDALRAQFRLNRKRRTSDPVTDARQVARMLDCGMTEGEIAHDGGYTVAQVEQLKLLLGLPEDVQKMVTDGRMKVTAAAALAKLDPEAISRAAKAMEAEGAKGRITTKKARAAAGATTADSLGRKAIKELIEELRNSEPRAMPIESAILALEYVLDARRAKDFWRDLEQCVKGRFKREETDAAEDAEEK